MNALLSNPLFVLLVLWVLSALARKFLIGAGESPVPSGAIVMAGGVFVIAALGELPLPEAVGRALVLELLVVWGYLAYSYLESALAGQLGRTVRQPMSAFAVGTWVAGSAVLGRAFVEVLPEWRVVAVALWVVAAIVWVFYLSLLPEAFRDASNLSGGFRATGVLLLPVVATQSLVVSGDVVLPGGLPILASAVLIVCGYGLYALGLVLLVRRYLLRSDWSLADDWEDSNCILHGALSITGLAIVQSAALPGGLAATTWLVAFVLFVAVEGVEVARAFVRVRGYGLRDGLLAYHAPQWSRNFTFGMFYAFTLQLAQSDIVSPASNLQGVIIAYGQYAVLTVMVLETALFFHNRIASGPLGDKTPRDRKDRRGITGRGYP